MTLDLFPIWHLRRVDGPLEEAEFSTNYKISIDDSTLRTRLQGEARRVLSDSEDAGLVARVQVLVNEVAARVSTTEVVEEGPYALHLRRRLTHLMRKPRQVGREEELICRGDELDASSSPVREFSVSVDLSQLSPPSRSAVHHLDLFSLRLCHALFGERVQTLEGYPPEAVPPLRRVAIFIAYRRTHGDVAGRVYEILQDMGGGWIFDAYLDAHDMELGNWKEQLMTRIGESDVFLPIVSPDYAATGSISHDEFRHAEATAEIRALSDFFAPIFIGNPDTAVGRELRKFDGFPVSEAAAIFSDPESLNVWLGRIAFTGFRRSSDDHRAA